MGRMAAAEAETQAREEGAVTKVCPRCGMELFSDMDVCYGCLYDFRRDRSRSMGPEAGMREGSLEGPVVGGMSIPLDEPDDDMVPGGEVPFPQRSAGQRGARHGRATASADATQALPPAAKAQPRYEVERGEIVGEGLGLVAGEDEPTMPLPNIPWEEVRLVEAPDEEAEEGRPPLALRVLAHDVELALPLPEGGLVVGRGRECDVVVRSRAVSRRHVRVAPAEDGAVVEDLGATNPAVVRGREVVGKVRIAVGEMVDVCGTRLVLERRAAG